MKKKSFQFSQDIPSGLVVFLVALPLCLGISLASGAPFFSGIIAGIIGGVVVGALSNSNLSVSGPAAGLAALVFAAIANLGDFRLFLCAVVLAGILQMVMGALKLGGIANYFPSSVIKGMLTSIGILIIAKQLPHATGHDAEDKGQLAGFISLGDEDWHDLLRPLHHIDVGVLLICIISIVVMILWDKPFIKKRVKFVPGALVAVLISVLINELLKLTQHPLTIADDHLVHLKAASSASEFLSFFTFPDFSGLFNSKVLVTALMISLIASLETLLCIEAIDNLDPERNVTNTNRELFAQGVGNTVSGLIGGLPITSVIVRSTANLHSGAKTKLATITHGLLLFISVLLLPKILNLIPLASLAAILLITGYKLCNFSVFKRMWDNGKYQFIPFITTVLAIISIDLLGLYKPLKGEGLLFGVFAGLVAAMISILLGNLKNSYYFHKENHHEGDRIKIQLSEEVSFLNKAAIRQTLDHLPENSDVTIDASNTKYIDFDVLEIIKEFKNIKAPLKNINCRLQGFKEAYNIENYSHVTSSH